MKLHLKLNLKLHLKLHLKLVLKLVLTSGSLLSFVLFSLLPVNARASERIFTYFEGHLRKSDGLVWQVSTPEGVYWISTVRRLSWVRRSQDRQISFWVATDQILRFRPSAMPPPPREWRPVLKVAHQAPAYSSTSLSGPKPASTPSPASQRRRRGA